MTTPSTETKGKALHRLPNGTWVNLATVRSITPLPTTNGGSIRARIVIEHGDHRSDIIYATDDLHAQQMADELAALVNQPA